MTYDSYKSLKVEKSNGIATVTINRPETLNAISMDVHAEIERIWSDIEHDDEVNVSILTGAGKCFSAGGNIKDMIERWGTQESRTMLAALPSAPSGWSPASSAPPSRSSPPPMATRWDSRAPSLLCDTSVISGDRAHRRHSCAESGLVAGDGGAVIWPL